MAANPEVTYELTHDDLFAFQWRAYQTHAAGQRARRTRYVSVAVIALTLATLPSLFAGYPIVTWFNALLFAVVFAVIAPLSGVMERRLTRRAIRDFVRREKPGHGQIGRHTVALRDDCVVETTAAGEMRTTWAGVDRVEDNDDYIFIYTSAAAAHVIPKRAFAGEGGSGFLQFARERKASANQLLSS